MKLIKCYSKNNKPSSLEKKILIIMNPEMKSHYLMLLLNHEHILVPIFSNCYKIFEIVLN